MLLLNSMKKYLSYIWLCIAVLTTQLQASSQVLILEIEGPIDPPIEKYIKAGIDKAIIDNYTFVLIIMDTPGGLMSSTKGIVDKIIQSSVPIGVFIFPEGARAASAGAFISMASHISAMAPGTHIGAAHPVTIGFGHQDTSKVMSEKATNDAIAWMKTLAQLRGRNTQWAERVVKHSEAVTAQEALNEGIIDFVAKDIDDFLSKSHGCRALTKNDTLEIELINPIIKKFPMPFTQKFLHDLLNPNIAYLLLIIGLLGLYFELQHPGTLFPGVAGTICLLSAIYAFQILPINYVGVLLIIAGVIMFILEVKLSGFGLLFAGGLISLMLGSFMLTSGNPPEFSIDWKVIVSAIAVLAIFFVFIVTKVLMTMKKKALTGIEGIVGEIGEVSVDIEADKIGKVLVHGEIWNARADQHIKKGTQVKVVKVQGMTIWVDAIQ